MPVQPSLSLCVRLLRAAGLAPPQRHRAVYRVYRAAVVGLVVHILAPEAAALVRSRVVVQLATQNVCIMFAYAAASYKLVAVLARRPRLLGFLQDLDASVTAMAAESAEAGRVVRRRDRRSRGLALFMLIQSTSTAFIWSMNSLRISLTKGSCQRILPVISWYPYDTSVWSNYAITFLIQFLSLITIAFSNRAMDTLIITLMCHVGSLLEMLNLKIRDISADRQLNSDQHRLEENAMFKSAVPVFSSVTGANEIPEGIPTRLSEDVSQTKLYNTLARCVEVHQEIIRYAKELERLVNDIFLIDFVCCMIVLCSTLCVSTSGSETFGDMMSHFGYLVTMTYSLLFYCLAAHDITEQSELVAMSAYCSPWPEANARYRRALCIVMCRAQRPLTLTAGKFYVISRATFLSLMNASYSYYQILREINDVKRND